MMTATQTQNDIYDAAIHRFKTLLSRYMRRDVPEPTAMILATADREGHPSVRTVLLKESGTHGFVFYTNTQSRKGQQLNENHHAALCFYWEKIGYQVTVEGIIEPVSSDEADDYWKTRPRASQIGAWASSQSRPLKNRKELLLNVIKYKMQFVGRTISRPKHWGGYRLIPNRIEFWKRHLFRLHERVVYSKRNGQWTKSLLYP